MSDDKPRPATKSYRRAGFGLGLAALVWTGALLFSQWREGRASEPVSWLVPIGAAALSVMFFSLSSTKETGKED